MTWGEVLLVFAGIPAVMFVVITVVVLTLTKPTTPAPFPAPLLGAGAAMTFGLAVAPPAVEDAPPTRGTRVAPPGPPPAYSESSSGDR